MDAAFPVLPWFQAPEPKNHRRTRNVSDNYRFYTAKMDELRVCREINRPLQGQLDELFLFVMQCEAEWESDSAQTRDNSRDA
jgi:hypothetical protein